MKRFDATWLTSISIRLASGSLTGVALVLTMACNPGGAHSGPVAIDPAKAPSIAEVASSTYNGIFEEPITLNNGRWEGPPFAAGGASRPSAGLVDHFVLTGDLDGDENTDAAVVLWEASGGSGNRLYLAAMGRRDGKVMNLGTDLIGDRVQIRSGVIDNGRIILDLVRAGPTDAACCPTEKAQVSWVLGADGLAVVGEEVTGTLSLLDLEGPEWILVELGWEQPVPDGSQVTLGFSKDKAAGNTGCNSYFAGVRAGGPGELSFTGMGTTRMACPEPGMALERSYLKALAGASSYGFLGGRLVIGCDTENGRVRLIFTPRETESGVPPKAHVE